MPERKIAKGMPKDPVLALRASQSIAELRQLLAAEKWREAAPLSYALVQLAPGLAEAHEIMGIVALKTEAIKIAETCFERAVSIGPATGFRLLHWGKALMLLDQNKAAEKIFHRALLMRPDDPAILSNLGDAQLRLGRQDDALKSYRRILRKDADHRYAAHMVAALSTAGVPDVGYVTSLFDNYAEFFDDHLTGTLHYRVPEALAALVSETGRTLANAVDVGCGTGLSGAAFRSMIETIDGIDLAPRMIEKARERDLYRHLAVGDAAEILPHDPVFAGPYDLVIAADVFIYIGALDTVFPALAAALSPDGLMAFSVETSQATDVQIRASGRFAHSQAYVSSLAEAHGLTILKQAGHDIRLENNHPIPGSLYVLGRL